MNRILPPNFDKIVTKRCVCIACESPIRIRNSKKLPKFCGMCGEPLSGKFIDEIVIVPKKVTPTSELMYKVTCDSCKTVQRYAIDRGERPNFCGECGGTVRYHKVSGDLIVKPTPLQAKSSNGI